MADTPPAPLPRKPVTGLDHAMITVTEVERSNAFYRDVAGADVLSIGDPPRWYYRFGDTQVNVRTPGMAAEPEQELAGPGLVHLCLVWDGPIEEAVAHLERHDVPIVDGPLPRPGARGEGRSIYFRDPDGALLELISYG